MIWGLLKSVVSSEKWWFGTSSIFSSGIKLKAHEKKKKDDNIIFSTHIHSSLCCARLEHLKIKFTHPKNHCIQAGVCACVYMWEKSFWKVDRLYGRNTIHSSFEKSLFKDLSNFHDKRYFVFASSSACLGIDNNHTTKKKKKSHSMKKRHAKCECRITTSWKSEK